jgi:protein-L-isoaspartate(D-aspartate) O-methyltransferase
MIRSASQKELSDRDGARLVGPKVLEMSDDSIREARRRFAEELRFVARVSDPRVVEAFASVPRERFVGPGPLRILSFWDMKEYWTPPDETTAAVYHDVLIAYDEKRRLNNGQPSLWAFVLDKLHVARGERVLHLGCGMGYYTAVLAELVGATGKVSAIGIDEPLAERAREALTPWPQVTLVNGDGANVSPGESDVVVASAAATHPLPAWLGCVSANGRLVFPMTVTNAGGGMLLARRRGPNEFDARFLCPVWFYEFAGARDAAVSDHLATAFAEDRGAGVRSARTDRHAEDATCWLHGDGWCLSRRELGSVQ